MDFSKYIMEDMMVLSMMYTARQVRYLEPLMVLKPSQSLATPRRSLSLPLPGLPPYRSNRMAVTPCSGARGLHCNIRTLCSTCRACAGAGRCVDTAHLLPVAAWNVACR